MKDRIGKFEILSRLGEGAMGAVYLGRDPLIGREVAIKVLHPQRADTPEARQRFFREAQAAGRLNHPNIVTVLEFGEDQGEHYLVMEYLPGQDLATALEARSLSPSEVLDILAQVCDGLAFAHRHGILHRDIKPSNIRLVDDQGRFRAKLLDFGIARAQGSDLTGSCELLGTFSYMAPEYIGSGQAVPQSDLFAVGVILYEALAGRKPFLGQTTANLFHNILHEQPRPPLAAHFRGVAAATGRILDLALAKDPAQRFATAESLAACLRAARDPAWPGPALSEPTATVDRPAGPRRRSPVLWLAAVGIPVLAAGLVLGRILHRPTPVPGAPPQPAAPTSQPGSGPGSALPLDQPDTTKAGGPMPAPVPAADLAAEPPEPPAADATRPPADARAKPPAEARAKPHGAARARASTEEPPAGPSAAADAGSPASAGAITSLDDAAAALDRHPAAALAWLNGNPQTGPSQRRALALRLVALYDLGRYDTCAALIRAIRGRGGDIRAMGRDYSRLGHVLRQERQDPHLPAGTLPAAGAGAE